jgi:hypothetical protein
VRPYSLRLRLALRGALLAQLLTDLPGGSPQLAVLLVVVGKRAQDQDRLALGRAVVEAEDGEPPHRLVVIVRRELVQRGPGRVDETGMLAREELERDQGRAAAGGALVLEPPAKQLGLLTEAELPDRAVRNSALLVVPRTGRGLELVGPLRPKPCELALGPLLGERSSLSGG